MKRLLVSLDDERYEDLRRFDVREEGTHGGTGSTRHRRRRSKTNSMVLRSGVDFEEHAKDPSGTITIQELMEQMGIELRRRTVRSAQRATRAAS